MANSITINVSRDTHSNLVKLKKTLKKETGLTLSINQVIEYLINQRG